jgi:hypothetical protein
MKVIAKCYCGDGKTSNHDMSVGQSVFILNASVNEIAIEHNGAIKNESPLLDLLSPICINISESIG